MTENQDNDPRPSDDQALGAALGAAIGRRSESLNRIPPIAGVIERSAAAANARRIRRTLVSVAAVAALITGLTTWITLGGDSRDENIRVATETTTDATTAKPAPPERPSTPPETADEVGAVEPPEPSTAVDGPLAAAAELNTVEDPEPSTAVDGPPAEGNGGTRIVESASTTPSPAEPGSDSPSLEASANELVARYTAVSVSDSHSCARTHQRDDYLLGQQR